MQNTKKTFSRFIVASIFFAVLFTALRILLINFNYDFISGFFSNKLLATCYYILIIAVAVFFYFLKPKYIENKFGITDTVFSVVFALLFIVLTFSTSIREAFNTPLEATMKYIAFASGIISAVHYILSSFVKKKSLICLTNIFPVIFFISQSILIFMKQSIQANTYNSFSNSISLIALAFVILYEGKAFLDPSEKRFISMRLITFFTVTQAVIPDIIFFIRKDFNLSFFEIIMTVIQFVYVLYFLIKTFNTEDKI